ncbi:MAG: DNA-3-methyladenine glycosylase 2 family protein [Chloroflexi bacterium]|nr:DNA-3-methyladenine glycosylase 2 family protein [Chloroflexota bacterium]
MPSSSSPSLASAARHLRRTDPRLAPIIAQVGPCTLRPDRRAFRTLVESIISQQISGKAANAIVGRFRALFPGRPFPSPVEVIAIPLERLRGAGLSNQKAAYVLDLAAKFADGTIRPARFSHMGDDEIAEQLIQVKGIGRWTAEMFLIFALNRLDVLPVGDLGLRAAVQRLYHLRKLPSAATIERLAEPWHPYCTVATWYLWRSLSLDGAG